MRFKQFMENNYLAGILHQWVASEDDRNLWLAGDVLQDAGQSEAIIHQVAAARDQAQQYFKNTDWEDEANIDPSHKALITTFRNIKRQATTPETRLVYDHLKQFLCKYIYASIEPHTTLLQQSGQEVTALAPFLEALHNHDVKEVTRLSAELAAQLGEMNHKHNDISAGNNPVGLPVLFLKMNYIADLLYET